MKPRTLIGAVALCFLARAAVADDTSTYSQQSVPPNIMWVIDDSGSMYNLPCQDFSDTCFKISTGDMNLVSQTVNGNAVKLCRSDYVDALGYNGGTTYAPFDPDFKGGGPPADFSKYAVWRSDDNNPWIGEDSSINNFCDNFSGCEQKSRCRYMLATYGYFYENSGCYGSGDPSKICSSSSTSTSAMSVVRVTGNFLHFYPPKYVAARKVFKDVISDSGSGSLVRQRMGLMVYGSDNQGGNLMSDMNPPCSQLCFDDTCNSNFFNNRAALRNKVDGLSFSTSTPLGETLDDVGCYFTAGNGKVCDGQGISFGGGTNNAPTCLACQRNFAIIITDGLPTSDGPQNPTNPANKGSVSTTDIGDQEVSKATGVTDVDPATGKADGVDYGYILPEVARYLFSNDLDPKTLGTQSVITYAISFGATAPGDPNHCAGVLQRATDAGNGKCVAARDASALKAAILAVLQDIDTRVRAFSAPAVQSTRAEGEVNANVATFKPDSRGPIWQGHVYAFQLWDERLQGTRSDMGDTTVNNELFVLDADGNALNYDQEGDLLSKPYWDAALCLAGDVDGKFGPLSPSDLYNLDVTGCYSSADESKANARKMYTKINPATQGTPDAFTVANRANLDALLAGTANTASNTKIIRFFRGFDMLDIAGKGTVATPLERNLSNLGQAAGWWKLGETFHSTPALVTGPTEYKNFYVTSTDNDTAYTSFAATNLKRQRILVAGANDGMIHAFDAGTATANATSTAVSYDHGTGKEYWAFAPNHHLTRMASLLDCPNDTDTPCTPKASHAYLIDGSPQVRDAYVPSVAATGATLSELRDSANASKWMTMAVVGDRDGGTQYTALDITDPKSPKYLWEFPQASDIGAGLTQRAEKAGRSWADAFPNPAPIFPVKNSSGNFTWVVALAGGFSRDQSAGRGIYLVDAKTGKIVWKFEYGAGGENQYMLYSFAGAVAGVAAQGVNASAPYFDKLVAADTGGQVWLFDISTGATTPGQRIFVTAAATATSSAYGSNPTPGNALTFSEYPYRPMFFIPATARDENGNLWAYLGTGDRDLLANPSLSDPSGVTLDADIPVETCGNSPYNTRTYANRIYGLKLARINTSRPNTESDLTDVTLAGSGSEGLVGTTNDPTVSTKAGWFLVLRPGEKVNNPADVFNSVAYFTTYRPTGACNQQTTSTNACSTPTGEGRFYALHYLKGTPQLNFTDTESGTTFGTASASYGSGGRPGGTISSADSSMIVDAGIPSAPNVSVGVANGHQSGSTLIATSSGGSPLSVAANTDDSLAKLIYMLPISSKLHGLLKDYGSLH